MKKNRPVFESFNAFVSFLNEKEEAPMDFKAFLSSNTSFLDADAKKAFDQFRLETTKAPLADKKGLAKAIGEVLGNMNDYIKDQIDRSARSNADVAFTEKSTTEVKKFIYPALINGNVNLNQGVSGYYGAPDLGKKIENKLSGGQWVDINDLFTVINIDNIDDFTQFSPGSLDGKGKKWRDKNDSKDDKDGKIARTGASSQYVISSIASGINFENNIPHKDTKILGELDFKKRKSGDVKADKKAYRTLVLYGIGNVVQGAGDTIPDTLIKKDFTTEVVTGPVKEYQVPLDGSDAMFVQGSANLNMKNKDKINQMLTAALAPLAGKPESIVITGGASYEPDGQGPINKKLVVDRANAVKTYLETLYPALKGVVTVNDKDFSKIQAKDVPAEYEKYRKVYFDIKGVLSGDSYTINKETEYLVDGEIKADTVEIIQYAISFEWDLTKDKEA